MLFTQNFGNFFSSPSLVSTENVVQNNQLSDAAMHVFLSFCILNVQQFKQINSYLKTSTSIINKFGQTYLTCQTVLSVRRIQSGRSNVQLIYFLWQQSQNIMACQTSYLSNRSCSRTVRLIVRSWLKVSIKALQYVTAATIKNVCFTFFLIYDERIAVPLRSANMLYVASVTISSRRFHNNRI